MAGPVISPIQIDDKDFLIASTIERCPKIMMIRELAQNAFEAAAQAAVDRRVEFRVEQQGGVPKLVIWNTGPGMDGLELKKMCDLAASIGKRKGLDANFGMGAKVASLPSNKRGLIYRSCKAGRVNEVILCFVDGKYGRLNRRIDDDTYADVIDITEVARGSGVDISYDWTEVVLLGNTAEQDTTRDPYAKDPEVDVQWLATYLYHRFYRIPGGIKVLFHKGTHKLDGNRHFDTIPARIEKGVFERAETVTTEQDIKIHYIYDASYDKMPSHNQSISGALQTAVSTGAIVYKNELYDIRTGRSWTMHAPIFGVPFGARHISIHIELPDAARVRPEVYRQYLLYSHGEQAQVQATDFADLVVKHRPQWLIELISSFAPDSQTNNEVREELQQLLDELRVKRVAPRISGSGAIWVNDGGGVGNSAVREGGGSSNGGSPRTRHSDLAEVPAGARRADFFKDRERAPEIILLREDSDIEEKQLRGRAARYYDHGQLFVNMRYPAVVAMQEVLEKDYMFVADLENMRREVVRLSEDAIIRRVGRATVYALAKHLNNEWSPEDVQQALKPESLSLAADDYLSSLQSARRSLGRLFRPPKQGDEDAADTFVLEM